MLDAILGWLIVGAAIWASALLLKRFTDIDVVSAVVLSTIFVPLLLLGVMFGWEGLWLVFGPP